MHSCGQINFFLHYFDNKKNSNMYTGVGAKLPPVYKFKKYCQKKKSNFDTSSIINC